MNRIVLIMVIGILLFGCNRGTVAPNYPLITPTPQLPFSGSIVFSGCASVYGAMFDVDGNENTITVLCSSPTIIAFNNAQSGVFGNFTYSGPPTAYVSVTILDSAGNTLVSASPVYSGGLSLAIAVWPPGY